MTIATAHSAAAGALVSAVLLTSCGSEPRDRGTDEIGRAAAVTTTSLLGTVAGAPGSDGATDGSAPPGAAATAGAKASPANGGATAAARSATSRGEVSAADVAAPPTTTASTEATTPPAKRRRPLRTGTYRYATTGFEQLDVGRNRHDYPSESTITFAADGCGVRSRWQPLPERWNETFTCLEGNGSALKELVSRREFSGQAKQSQHACLSGTWASPPDDGARKWSGRCANAGDELHLTGRVLPSEVVAIDGQRLEARRLDIVVEMRGSSRGSGLQQVWLHPDDGLPLRVKSSLDLEVYTMVGPTRYRETYELQLASLTPSG